ncbi:hypothetical protein [Sphingomonas sp. S2-65]|uniref:hypothetical protein n=1 Tax=Sphingomonas sp. S2-65 TaxID=2903960 RepID=UPI001F1B6372|nr:hypothetical protein [Sphingomonas sp. S2-65]UYY59803.1 hypothetical protein LZ586_06885 [Sphingomonas sp. S2-65]
MKMPVALLGAGFVGGLAALAALVLPTAMLESVVMDSGLPSIIAAAEPPLGFTARFCLALGAGGFFGIVAGLTLFVLFGTKDVDVGSPSRAAQPGATRAPVLRRADAHPDAPPRPPLMAARDLGTPFLEVGAGDIPKPLPLTPPKPAAAQAERPMPGPELPAEDAPLPLVPVAPVLSAASLPPVEQPLPRDLDQPLAAFDPQAVPDVPLPPPVLPPLKPKPVVEIEEPATPQPERFEVFELTPQRRRALLDGDRYPFAAGAEAPVEERLSRPETEASVHALLDRLERGVIRRGMQNPTDPAASEPRIARGEDRGLADTLASLRSMALRA